MIFFINVEALRDHLCGLVVTVPEIPGLIPGATTFSEECVWKGVHSLVRITEELPE
jgi:hypothetical protein